MKKIKTCNKCGHLVYYSKHIKEWWCMCDNNHYNKG